MDENRKRYFTTITDELRVKHPRMSHNGRHKRKRDKGQWNFCKSLDAVRNAERVSPAVRNSELTSDGAIAIGQFRNFRFRQENGNLL
ncbi:hypothetical protein CDAR_78061 [Caerostris darwini]|uniref:Uncharacterized protein n=1 Tax=Caerostris darwini TaxID=1538125 RepID=A0AAV4M4T5_9ARAC|nr:hypothetical protein CDAR_78061 [Caerostris darwini]